MHPDTPGGPESDVTGFPPLTSKPVTARTSDADNRSQAAGACDVDTRPSTTADMAATKTTPPAHGNFLMSGHTSVHLHGLQRDHLGLICAPCCSLSPSRLDPVADKVGAGID
jgi:hypothetical protein